MKCYFDYKKTNVIKALAVIVVLLFIFNLTDYFLFKLEE